jgi:hypothetical protein
MLHSNASDEMGRVRVHRETKQLALTKGPELLNSRHYFRPDE